MYKGSMQGLDSTLVVVIGRFGASFENTIDSVVLNSRSTYPFAVYFDTSDFVTNWMSVIGHSLVMFVPVG